MTSPAMPGPGPVEDPREEHERGWRSRTDVFRQEALAHHADHRDEGEVLKISPRWTRWAYGTLLAALVVGVIYAVLGTVHEYAAGPAIIRLEAKTSLTAKVPGTVQAVSVQPRQRVEPGDLVVELSSAEESATLERIEHELQLQLVKVLRDPTDQVARQSLIGLRTQEELAQARLDQRRVCAPVAGAVSDIRVRAGQHLDAGDLILSIIGDDARLSVVAMMPAHYRPMLQVGAPLRLELTGYRYAYHELVIDGIGDEVIGRAEVRRYLGPELADTVPIDGPVVLVRAHLDSPSFQDHGRTFDYFDGMQGLAEARVRSESVLGTLVPGLKRVFSG